MGTPLKAACLAVLLLAAAGCSGDSDHELFVVFPKGAAVRENEAVYVDGVRAGSIESVEQMPNGLKAHLVLKRQDLVESSLKVGVRARDRKDGGIDLLTADVAAGAAPLKSGGTLQGERSDPLHNLLREYATAGTLALAIAGLLVIIVLVKIFRAVFSRRSLGLAFLASLVLTALAHPLIVPWVERDVYSKLESVRKAEAERRDKLKAAEKASHTTAPAEAPDGAAEVRATNGREITALEVIGDKLVKVPLPHPRVTAFFLFWTASFVLLQLVFGVLFRTRRKTP